MKPLKYPFTYEQWLKHPSTKPKIKWCKEIGDKIKNEKKFGKQLDINF